MLFRKKKEAKGICVEDTEFKISQYTDDTTLILDGSSESFLASLAVLERFGQLCGLKINYDKTKAFWIGTSRLNNKIKVKNKNIKWAEEKVKALDVWFTLDVNKTQMLNYTERREKIIKITQDWSHRRLTLMGKITVIKSLLASQLVYILSPLPSNDYYFKMIQNDLFTFLWNGKKDKIKRSEMINDYEDGGLKMLNLKFFSRSLKFTWIQKYLNDESHEKWKVFADNYYLKQLGGKLIFSCNLRKDDISHINISNEFLKELLEIWTEVHFIQSNGLEENDIKNQLIWYNYCIRVENKPIYYKTWAANGINKIKDISDNENDILDFGKFQKMFNNLKAHYLDFIRIISLIKKLLNPLQPRLGKKREQTKIITIQEAASGSKLNRVAYSLLLKNIATVPQKSQLKWSRDLEACQKNEIHKKIILIGKRCTLYLFPAQAPQV